jgi:hypothetical protein
MHVDFANLLSLVSTVTLIGALVFTGLQVRAANRARREQATVTAIQTTALSENSARILELLGEIPQGASAAAIDNLDAEAKRQIFQFGLRLEVTATWFLMEWSIFKSSTSSLVALFSDFGRARKIGRSNDGSARVKLNSWNGANGL